MGRGGVGADDEYQCHPPGNKPAVTCELMIFLTRSFRLSADAAAPHKPLSVMMKQRASLTSAPPP